MAISFNADEIYNIAEQIERNGHKFYSDSAMRVKDSAAKQILQDLASMEIGHLKAFKALHAGLSEKAREEITWDPDGEAGAYLKAAADSHIFKTNADPSSLLKNNTDAREILELALQFEKDSVIYFLGVAEVVPDHLGKADVLGLAKQEQSHIALIQNVLSKL